MEDTENLEMNENEEIENEAEEIESETPESETEESQDEGEESFDLDGIDEDELFSLDESEDVEESEEIEPGEETSQEEGALTDEAGEPEAGAEAPKELETSSGLQKYEQFNARAKEAFKRRFGVEYDEFEDSHRDAINDVKQSLKNEDDALDTVKSIYERHDEAFAKFVQTEAYNAKNGDMEKLRKAEARGDFSATIDFLKKVEEKFQASKAAKEKADNINKGAGNAGNRSDRPRPPKTLPPSTGSRPASRSDSSVFGLKELGMDE